MMMCISRITIISKIIKIINNKDSFRNSFYLNLLHGTLNEDSKILSHETTFNSFNDSSFKLVTEIDELFVLVEPSSVEETSSPSKDGGNGICRSFLTL